MIDMSSLGSVPLTFLAWFNFIVCGAIGWACVCRVAMMTAKSTLFRVRFGYTIMMVCSTSSGLSPVLWGEWPGPGQVSMGVAIFYIIIGGAKSWSSGPPLYARKLDAKGQTSRHGDRT